MGIINAYLSANPSIAALIHEDDDLCLVGRVRYEHDRGVPGVSDPLYSLDILLMEDNRQLAEIPVLKIRPGWKFEDAYKFFQLTPEHMKALLIAEVDELSNTPAINRIVGRYDGRRFIDGKEKIDEICFGDLLELN